MKQNDIAIQICLAFVLTSTLPAFAAERKAAFAISAQQMQTLDIQVEPLKLDAASVVEQLPAQVVIPPENEQVVSSPMSGLITQFLVQQNQLVKQGAPLLRITSPEFGQLQLQLIMAASKANLARQNSNREAALFEEGIIPQRRVQEAQANLRESEAALYQAKSTLRISGFSAGAIDKLAASGKIEDGLVLRATQAGIVTSIDAKLGQRVEASTALLRLAQTDVLSLDIQAPAADAGRWKPGAKIKIQGRDQTARLISTGSSVTAGNQSVTLRATIEGSATGLRAGEYVTVEMPAGTTEDGWNIPLASVAHDGNQTVVFVRSAKGFDATPVKVVASAGQRVRVQGNLKLGDKIAVTGIVALKGSWLDDKGSN